MTLLVRLGREAIPERHLLPEPLGLVRQHARSADAVVEQAACRQRRVANHLRRQSPARTPCEQPILWISLVQSRRYDRGLAIRGGRDDQTLHRANIPRGPHEFGGEPVEELRVRWRLALDAEVFLGL